ncbi:hypothetical protein G4Y79_08370 [Phototrophicus methaneseepsis]|uniref:Uncharacterized protein n=1 Tax=Phototrophicus methaneseepsis TaxID=2710758 RepID=A0A7S8IF61_9CHLR|nr:hypothetical protein [Phototrophicus methaneseepsis]QPC84375.1 hypothetical protein G4Y79_08370 [Phototrophicus methaneseepsis]
MTKRPLEENLRPDCSNCDFFKHGDHFTERRCAKYDFVMPRVDWQILCNDWQHEGQNVNFSFEEDETLYYYSAGSGEIIYAPISPLQELQSLLISVSVRRDEEYGWIIFPRQYRHYFPEPDTRVVVVVGDRKCAFQVTNAERRLAAEMIPSGGGKWETHYHTQSVFMLYSLESPDLLYDWLDSFMNLERMIDASIAPSVFAFMEVRNRNREYILHADLLTYNNYLRE